MHLSTEHIHNQKKLDMELFWNISISLINKKTFNNFKNRLYKNTGWTGKNINSVTLGKTQKNINNKKTHTSNDNFYTVLYYYESRRNRPTKTKWI